MAAELNRREPTYFWLYTFVCMDVARLLSLVFSSDSVRITLQSKYKPPGPATLPFYEKFNCSYAVSYMGRMKRKLSKRTHYTSPS